VSNGHRPDCDGCIRCDGPGCEEVAYCVNERPVENLCPHYVQAVCVEHWPGTCPHCQVQAEQDAEPLAAVRLAFDRFDGDPFRRPGDDSDPLPELAAESRAVTERFWAGVMRHRSGQGRGLA
jgi:hypothetical protein